MLATKLRIAIAQTNPTVGDLEGNRDKILRVRDAHPEADLVIFPELSVSGYPPEDLVTRPAYLGACAQIVEDLTVASAQAGPAMLVGAPWPGVRRPYNSVVLLAGGQVQSVSHKHVLPNYGVFDEKRVFEEGPLPTPMEFRGLRLGVMICEDFWYPQVPARLLEQGAHLLVALNASPFSVGKAKQRAAQARERVSETGMPLIYINQIGGQDELVFDGSSFALAADGSELGRLPAFCEATQVLQWTAAVEEIDTGKISWSGAVSEELTELDAVYAAMCLGLRDYVNKNGFPGVIIGLSGGIDSALTAAVAVDALGPDRVRCVMMPSPYTSQESLEDAAQCASNLGVHYDVVSIEPAMGAYEQMLAPIFSGEVADVTEENIQSRARGLLLMAMSNKFGWMLLTTGNKSEMAMGYATLYGDMCGGYSVLKDVYKTMVFELALWRNKNNPTLDIELAESKPQGPVGEVIPKRIITKPPSAELRPDQKDSDSLPPYAILDGILECLIESDLSVAATVARGFDGETVERIAGLLAIAEYKRRQAPPGVKITRRSFSLERRYPITNRYREGRPETVGNTNKQAKIAGP